MIINRNTIDNVLLNKHKINTLPILETKNNAAIETIAGNELRILNTYPLAYDFLTNMIHKAKSFSNKNIADIDEYKYAIILKDETFDSYFSRIKDPQKKYDYKKKLINVLTSTKLMPFLIKEGNSQKIIMERPFDAIIEVKKEGNKVVSSLIKIYFSKAIFKPLIEDRCKGDGYITIPDKLFPVIMNYDRKNLVNHNPIYKIQVLGLLKNTHQKDLIEINYHEFMKNIFPEYLRKDGYLKTSKKILHNETLKGTKETINELNNLGDDSFLVNNFYMGSSRDNITIYFKKM